MGTFCHLSVVAVAYPSHKQKKKKSVVITASGRLSHSTIWVSTKGLETFYIDAVIIKCDPIAFVELTNHRYE